MDPEAPDLWPFTVHQPDAEPSRAPAGAATGPYGRCVYRCDNDVVDHQMVLMELDSGASVILVMHGHSNVEHRSMRYDGTKGTLRARALEPETIEINIHGGKREQYILPAPEQGHGGGDEGIMPDFVRCCGANRRR